jgi:hypothetical protein
MAGKTRHEKRIVLVGVRKATGSLAAAARIAGFRRAAAERWDERYRATGSVKDAPRSGRPAMLSAAVIAAAQARVVELQSVRQATNALVKEGLLPPGTHHSTIYRSLSKGPGAIKCKGVRRTPLITPKTQQRRRQFAKHHQHKRTCWDRVLFVDSKYFYVSIRGSSRVWVPAEATAQRPAFKKSAGLHVYGAFSAAGTAPLVIASGTSGFKFPGSDKGVNALEYQHILREHLLPAARRLFKGGKWQLLHDSAKPHTAKATQAFLKCRAQVVALWPANSPDLNPIENLWSWVRRRINKMHVTDMDSLKAAVFKAWSQIPAALLRELAGSMTKRLQLVVERKGAHTGY